MNDYYHKIQLHRLITRSSCNICVLFNVTKTRTFTSGTVTVTHCTNTVVLVCCLCSTFRLITDTGCVLCVSSEQLSCHICPATSVLEEKTLYSHLIFIFFCLLVGLCVTLLFFPLTLKVNKV